MQKTNLLLPALFVATLLTPAFAQNTSHVLQGQLIDTDRRIWQAIAGSQPNIAQVSQSLAPDYIDMELAVSHSRNDVLKDLKAVSNFSFQYANPRAFVLSPTSGYVIAELTYSSTSNGKTDSGKVVTTTVFSKENGRWLAHLHTEMDLKPAPEARP